MKRALIKDNKVSHGLFFVDYSNIEELEQYSNSNYRILSYNYYNTAIYGE